MAGKERGGNSNNDADENLPERTTHNHRHNTRTCGSGCDADPDFGRASTGDCPRATRFGDCHLQMALKLLSQIH